jgi:hypothetical protein
MRRILGLLAVGLLVSLGLGSLRPSLAEPPPAGKLDPNDPLLKALEQIRRDVDNLKSEMSGGTPQPRTSVPSIPSSGMSAPGMSGPSMSGPSMPRPAPQGPDGKRPTPSPSSAPTINLAPAAKKTDHWSFQPVRRPAVPAVKNTAWPASDLDRFILSRIEAKNLQPTLDADAAVLCRRVYLDLTGLPPTPEELETFVAKSKTESAYAALVDSLLASPRFGERWARHWLDVVRYADSVGRSWNAPFTYAWRYRDYVVDAFNADVPYDRFIAEQLAGDLLKSNDVDERRAQLSGGGFLGLGSLELRETGDQFVMDQIDDQIDVTTRAFLGITVACARCHDHKYDPISMYDYYALAGIFYSTETLPGQAGRNQLGAGGYVDADRLVRLPTRGGVNTAASVDGGQGIHSMSDFQQAWSQNRNVRYTTDPNVAMGMRDGDVRDCEFRVKGEAYDLGPAVPRGDLRIPSLPKMPSIPRGVSGRLELARWIGSPQHPLTARVMTNRIWQHLFGRGLVRTVDDFGVTGEGPTHPELLDWLADDFVRNGWSMKKLIRQIVLSRTYRLASTGSKEMEAADPDNLWYWRSTLRALEFEPLRDSMLYVAGRLDEQRPFGIQVVGTGGKQGNRSLLSINDPYRTIYLPVMRSHVPDVYGVFNFPEPTQIQGLRAATTVAPQALFLMNDRFAVDCASAAAERMLAESPQSDAAAIVRRTYLRLFARPPTVAETKTALAFLMSLQPAAAGRDDVHYRWSALMQAMFAAAEFRYVR